MTYCMFLENQTEPIATIAAATLGVLIAAAAPYGATELDATQTLMLLDAQYRHCFTRVVVTGAQTVTFEACASPLILA